MPKIIHKLVATLALLIVSVHTRCSFEVGLDNVPVKVDKDPHMISGMSLCSEYNGQMGCCGEGNDRQ